MADAEQFSLRWNNFHSNLSEGFHSLLEEVDLVDVTLAAEGQYLQAHKIVLSVCSPYFKQLFKANPCKHPIVILKDVCHKDLEALLQFMYQGEVNVCQEELAPFLKTAEMLQIKGLTGNDSKSSIPSQSSPVSRVQSPPPPTLKVAREPITKQDSQNSAETSRPFKRLRTESPHMGTSPLSSSNSTSHTMTSSTITTSQTPSLNPPEQSEIEFVPIPNPKLEPVEYENEADGCEESPADLVQMLQCSESSQPPPDLSSGPPVLFNPVAGLPQDSGGSQDSMQGMPLSERKIMQVGDHELHLTALRGRNNSRLRRRCVPCYDMNRRYLGNHTANLRTAKVSTYCATCKNSPFMCVTCFKIHSTGTSLGFSW